MMSQYPGSINTTTFSFNSSYEVIIILGVPSVNQIQAYTGSADAITCEPQEYIIKQETIMMAQ